MTVMKWKLYGEEIGWAPKYVIRIKIPNYLATGGKNGYCSGFEYISQAKEQLNDSGHVSRFSFHHLHSVSNKVEQNFVSELFFWVISVFMHNTYANV